MPLPSPTAAKRRRRRIVFGLGGLAYLVAAGMLANLTEHPLAAAGGRLAIGAFFALAAVWLFVLLWRRALRRVGRRLAFSYFLVGVLPLGLIALVVALTAYLVGGFLLGHLYRDAIDDLRDEVETAALSRLGTGGAGRHSTLEAGDLHFATYRHGLRVGNDEEAPESWPEWLAAAQAARNDVTGEEIHRPFVALRSGALSVAAVAGAGDNGVLAWFDGDLGDLLRRRTRTWLQLYRADDPRKLPVTRLQIAGRVLSFRGLWIHRDPAEEAEFYRLSPPRTPHDPSWTDRPTILWMEQTGTLRGLADGKPVTEAVAVSLAASSGGLYRAMLSASERADSTAWIALAGVSVLLFEIWAVAAAVAIFMIVGLSRAVNRLSKATDAIGRGDFTYRIPVKRRDQVGDLQRSFNTMAEHLGELVETAAQKEAIDKELELARRVQRDLLPDALEAGAGVDIATTFEPSSAIGGDYFDILRRPGGRLAVVVADVSGHGLAAGLRMAMVKSALALLVEEELAAPAILDRLRRLLRARPGERGFVSLTLSEFDPGSGELQVTNAGHPPCYLVRREGRVEEIALPGAPLGALPGPPGIGAYRLAAGDGVVWLSDGIPECLSTTGDPFGYERVERALAGAFESAEELRDRLLGALRTHCSDAPVEDDRTLVVLRYVPERKESPSTP